MKSFLLYFKQGNHQGFINFDVHDVLDVHGHDKSL